MHTHCSTSEIDGCGNHMLATHPPRKRNPQQPNRTIVELTCIAKEQFRELVVISLYGMVIDVASTPRPHFSKAAEVATT